MVDPLAHVRGVFDFTRDELRVGGVPIGALVAEYGTPLFVYDRDVLDRQWRRVRDTFPDRFSIYYSVKANPNRAILEYFLNKGCGLEIASAGEYHLVRGAGCPADKIVFAGPGKTENELEHVLRQGIDEIHLESSLEARRISAIGRRLNVKARVAVRINPSAEAQGGAMHMGGIPAPFGVDEENLDAVLSELVEDESIEVTGIHLFVGTQILDHKILLRQYRKGLDLARHTAERIKRPLNKRLTPALAAAPLEARSVSERVTGPAFSVPNPPDRGWATAHRDGSGPDA